MSAPVLTLVTPPAVEPVTSAMVKTLARVDSDLTADDDLVALFIADARADAEHLTNRKLIEQTWDVVMDEFPLGEIKLSIRPIISVESVTYIDAAGDSQVIDAANYTLDIADEARPFLQPAIDYVWPPTLDTGNAVVIRVKAGYGDAASDVPAGARSWIAIKAASKLPQSGVEMTEHHNRGLDKLTVYGD